MVRRAHPLAAPARGLWRRLALIRETRAILFLALLFVAFLTLSLVVHSPGLLEIDRGVSRAVQSGRGIWLDGVARSLTFLGNSPTLLVLALGTAAYFLATRRPWAALLCVTTLLGLPLNIWLKQIVGRPRPEEGMVAVLLPSLGLSFPSGHAMLAVLFYGFLALMAWVHVRRRRARLLWTSAFALVAVGVSLSRVYLGAHWFSDVIGGWTAGLFLLFLLAELYRAVAGAELAPAAAGRGRG